MGHRRCGLMLGPCHVLGSTCGHISHAAELRTGSARTHDVRGHTPAYATVSTFPMPEHPRTRLHQHTQAVRTPLCLREEARVEKRLK